MSERLRSFINHPRFIILRRLVMVVVYCILIERLAGALYIWECDLLEHAPLWRWLHVVALVGMWGAPGAAVLLSVVWGVRSYRARRSAKENAAIEGEESVQLELPLKFPPPCAQGRFKRFWDVWLLVVVALVTLPLTEWYQYLVSCRSELTVSCLGGHAEQYEARAECRSSSAPAAAIGEHLPVPESYLHRFYLPDGDYHVKCSKSGDMFTLSHIRKTRRFTLRPLFAPADEVELHICPIRTDAERKRVMALLNYYMGNPQALRPRIRRMPFTRCQDASVLYLDYGEYVLLPIPQSDKPTNVPQLFYLSLQP